MDMFQFIQLMIKTFVLMLKVVERIILIKYNCGKKMEQMHKNLN